MEIAAAVRELRVLFDAPRYLELYPDVLATGMDPVEHYLRFGADEGREPCALFDGSWYRTRYPDVAASGLNPLLHYIRHGGMEMRDPNPRFNAAFYVDAHPEAIGNPLLYHLLQGAKHAQPTEPPLSVGALLPAARPTPGTPPAAAVDIVIPVYRGLVQTRRCIESVLADPARPAGHILVVDDCSPEPRLSAYLDRLAGRGVITLLRNARNLGFVRSVNRAIAASKDADIVLLNADTVVPPGWLTRLARAAHAKPDIATVSPFSNNATICSYPTPSGGPFPPGLTLERLDAACREANTGRVVDLPTTVGFCMYIRRAALGVVGPFDANAFGHGYGEEVDFCRRAAALGWRNVLATDVFVYHEGEVSFGADSPHARRGQAMLRRHHPEYEAELRRHTLLAPSLPARFALTAALFRQNGLPGILFVTHAESGGVQRQWQDMIASLSEMANIMLLRPDPRGVTLAVPTIPGHPTLTLAGERMDDLALYLRSAAIRRVHIHHVMDLAIDLRRLIARLDVPFDFTLHDYFTVCPQVNLLPRLDGQYCGEPEPRHCNACIAARPSHGATDIDTWRRTHAWLLTEAARVLCPSQDAVARLIRLGLGQGAMLALHEPVMGRTWPITPAPRAAREKLRIALLGVLADRKGLAAVAAVAETMGPDMSLHLIGYPEQALEPGLATRISVSGAYDDTDLPRLIAELRPHVIWFPAQWPETYSYTLSAAIAAGAAIVATNIGAFPERLAGRPLTWLVPPGAPAQAWLDAFEAAGAASRPRKALAATPRTPSLEFYPSAYLAPLAMPPIRQARSQRPRRRRIVVIPEYLDTGLPSPCAYIRLLQPLHHPAIGAGLDVQFGRIGMALDDRPDMIVTHRLAVPDPDDAAALIAHCRAHRIRLAYDLDDDLLALPHDHPHADRLAPMIPAARALLRAADRVWTSTATLATRLGPDRKKAMVVPNGLDERLWWPPPLLLDRPDTGIFRLVYMGTDTHAADLTVILPALQRLRAAFGDAVRIDIVGVTTGDLPDGLRRVAPPHHVTRSYPAFINWLSLENRWDAGLAPLADTRFNRAKSAIKAMDYAALGLPTIASAIGVYEATVTHGTDGLLIGNTDTEWFTALAALARDPRRRQAMAIAAHAAFTKRHTLRAQAVTRRRIVISR